MPLNIVWRDKADPAEYEKARVHRLWNAKKSTQRPLAIAFVRNTSEIVDVVNIAIQEGCQVSVRAGGHSYEGWSVRDGAILIDFGEFSEGPSLDEETGIVSICPSMTGEKLVHYLSSKGRFCSVGHCPDVGLGGFLLGGGMGWNSNNWGWACEQVVAVDVVTADGRVIRADSQQNSDLFWAARGAGPAFPGIVTRFHLQTRPAVRCMLSSGYVYPLKDHARILSWAFNTAATLENIEMLAIGNHNEDLSQPCLTVAMTAFGDQENSLRDSLQLVENSRPDGALVHWFCEKTNMEQQLENTAQAFPADHRYYVDNLWLNDDIQFSILDCAFTSLPSKKSMVLWQPLFPGSQRELPDMALSMRSNHWLSVYAIWDDETDDVRCRSTVQEAMLKLEPHSKGSYLGELDFRARKAKYWADDHLARLLDIRSKWDHKKRICGCLGLDNM